MCVQFAEGVPVRPHAPSSLSVYHLQIRSTIVRHTLERILPWRQTLHVRHNACVHRIFRGLWSTASQHFRFQTHDNTVVAHFACAPEKRGHFTVRFGDMSVDIVSLRPPAGCGPVDLMRVGYSLPIQAPLIIHEAYTSSKGPYILLSVSSFRIPVLT